MQVTRPGNTEEAPGCMPGWQVIAQSRGHCRVWDSAGPTAYRHQPEPPLHLSCPPRKMAKQQCPPRRPAHKTGPEAEPVTIARVLVLAGHVAMCWFWLACRRVLVLAGMSPVCWF